MINILEKKDCCGCASCVQVCPKQCISMTEDCEGFLYPKVDSAVCVDCGLCEKVCPIINQGYTIVPLVTYAAKNKDEKIRYKSSSGGVFTLIAEQILADGGVVFGARFNENWVVIHDYAETVEGLEPFRGSKYVQSVIGDNYKYAKQFLLEGRKVLFSGTPCQIAGLKKFLRKEYENLLTVEVVCHGVPSPKVWKDYLQYRRAQHVVGKNTVPLSINELPGITGISFRDKTNGWKKYGFKICYAALKAAENSVSKSANIDNCEITPFNEDIFMKGFLKNLYLRPSCYQCMAKQGKSGADIAIADYWGIQRIHQELDDDKGVNLVLINTQKGQTYFDAIAATLTYTISDYRKAIANNPCIVKSVAEPSQRVQFWREYESQGIACINGICQSMIPSKFRVLFSRIVRKLKSFVR